MKKRDKNVANQLFFYKFGVKIQKLDFNAPLNPNKIFHFKNVSIWQRAEQIDAFHAYHRRVLGTETQPPEAKGIREKAPNCWTIFVIFRKNSNFKAIWIKFRTISEPFERTKSLTFGNQLKN